LRTAVLDEHWPDQVVDAERGLAHQTARPVGLPVAAQPYSRELAMWAVFRGEFDLPGRLAGAMFHGALFLVPMRRTVTKQLQKATGPGRCHPGPTAASRMAIPPPWPWSPPAGPATSRRGCRRYAPGRSIAAHSCR